MIAAVAYSGLDGLALRLRHDARLHVVIERENLRRLLTDREGRPGHNRRNQRLKARTIQRQFAFENRIQGRDLGAQRRGHRTHERFGPRGRERANLFHWCPEPFNPQRTVGVEHDFDHCRVFQQFAYLRPEFAPQFFRYALIVFCTI